MNLAAVLEARARSEGWAARPALIVDGRPYSHDEVHDGAARAASLLAGRGVRRGDAVLLALPDGVELAWAFLAAVRLGALAVPVNPDLPVADHRVLAADCGATLAVCPEELAERFAGSGGAAGRNGCRVIDAATLAGAPADHQPHPAAPVDGQDSAYAQYTSGTTGAPRAAVHRHADPPVYGAAFAGPALRLSHDDVLLSVSKMYFAYGLGNSLFFPLLTGASAVLHPRRPRPDDVVALIRSHQVTALFAVPTFYANLLRAEPAEASFTSVRVAVSAGERLPSGVAEPSAALLGCPLLDSLGSTEVGQAFVGGALDGSRPGTLGRALPPYEVAVRDDHGADVPAGAVGMLWVRGPTVLLRYLGQPEATAAALDGSWLRTGDLASVDADGFVSHHGRADDMEMVGGITVAPQEVEELLSLHPAVSEVAVAAVEDPSGASRLHAFVVPAPDAPVGEQLGRELTEMARSRLAAYKVPRSVIFLEALPRTATGKLRRFVLRAGAGAAAVSPAG